MARSIACAKIFVNIKNNIVKIIDIETYACYNQANLFDKYIKNIDGTNASCYNLARLVRTITKGENSCQTWRFAICMLRLGRRKF